MGRTRLGIGIVVATVAALAVAQDSPPRVSVVTPQTAVKPGSKVTVTVRVVVPSGLHAYQNPPSDRFQIPLTVVVDGNEFRVGRITYPRGVPYQMKGADETSMVYMGTVNIPVEVTVPNRAGRFRMPITVRYQHCSDRTCYPPKQVKAEGWITVRAR